MKSLIIVFPILLLLLSCKKEEDKRKETNDSFSVALSKNELYVYDTKNSGDEEGGSVVEQAKHYQISEVVRDSAFNLVYRYQPEKDYVGKDSVQIMLSSGSDGASPSSVFEYITIRFTIME